MALHGTLELTHEQQEKAAERVRNLMKHGLSSGEAIAQVAQEIRTFYKKNGSTAVQFDEIEH